MATPRASSRNLVKQLQRKQGKHAALLIRIEKATARLQRRTLKLQAIEASIADLVRRAADPRARHAPAHGGNGSLRHARLIFNLASGRDKGDGAERLQHVVGSLRIHGIQAEIGLKTSGKVARQMAREAVRKREPLIIVAAGDGTIEDVASELVGSDTVLGIVPIGTMNNLARSLGVPLDIDDACALIGMGVTRRIDIGRVFSNTSPHIEYFLEGAGVGLSALAAVAGQSIEKGRWSFVPRALRTLFESKLGTIQVQMDDQTVEVSSQIVTVSNSPLLGSNLLVAPGAKMDDGLLDIIVYDGMGPAALTKHFIAASRGEAQPSQIYHARRVRITAEGTILANADKNVMEQRHVVEIELVPKAMSVIAGNGIGLTLPVEAAPPAPPMSGEPHANGSVVEEHSLESVATPA
jgi:diacylglycerol kinase (ATP)